MNDARRSSVIATEIAKRNVWLEEFEALNPIVLPLHMAGIVKKYCRASPMFIRLSGC